MYIIESPFVETIRLNKNDILYFDLYDNCTKMKDVLKNHKVIFPEKLLKQKLFFSGNIKLTKANYFAALWS